MLKNKRIRIPKGLCMIMIITLFTNILIFNSILAYAITPSVPVTPSSNTFYGSAWGTDPNYYRYEYRLRSTVYNNKLEFTLEVENIQTKPTPEKIRTYLDANFTVKTKLYKDGVLINSADIEYKSNDRSGIIKSFSFTGLIPGGNYSLEITYPESYRQLSSLKTYIEQCPTIETSGTISITSSVEPLNDKYKSANIKVNISSTLKNNNGFDIYMFEGSTYNLIDHVPKGKNIWESKNWKGYNTADYFKSFGVNTRTTNPFLPKGLGLDIPPSPIPMYVSDNGGNYNVYNKYRFRVVASYNNPYAELYDAYIDVEVSWESPADPKELNFDPAVGTAIEQMKTSMEQIQNSFSPEVTGSYANKSLDQMAKLTAAIQTLAGDPSAKDIEISIESSDGATITTATNKKFNINISGAPLEDLEYKITVNESVTFNWKLIDFTDTNTVTLSLPNLYNVVRVYVRMKDDQGNILSIKSAKLDIFKI